ncbi:MAG: permease-like cell division protein FtsX [Erysipelotrichaceae bacterium]
MQTKNKSKQQNLVSFLLFIITIAIGFGCFIGYQKIEEIEGTTQIHVQLEDKLAGSEYDVLLQKIKSYPITDVTYQDKYQELKKMKTFYGEEGSFLDTYKDDNPLKDALLIQVKDFKTLKPLTSKINKLDGVFHASYGGEDVLDGYYQLNQIKNGLLFVGGVIGIISCFLLWRLSQLIGTFKSLHLLKMKLGRKGEE